MKLKYIKDPDLNLIADLQNGWSISDDGVLIELRKTGGVSTFKYSSLEDFNREWATLKEPLLHGKLRESLKLWAEYHGVGRLRYRKINKYSIFYFNDENFRHTIDYEINTQFPNLKDCEEYSLKDLVGE